MNIGNPFEFTYSTVGMTYRQWLIGQALAGCDRAPEQAAHYAIRCANEVIALLDKEANVEDAKAAKEDGER